jgi:integrase
LDARHEVLPQALIPSRARRPHPYIYTENEVKQIVQAAAELPSHNGIRPLTCSTLFGLIAVTGLRVSEALALNASDVDLASGVLTVRKGKFGKARLVPVADSVRVQLAEYACERDRLLGAPSQAFFVADHGARLTDCGARYSFAAASRAIGLRSFESYRRHGHGPRIHDLRLAVRTLLSWYRNRDNPSQEMIKLSTYLGHADPTNTYCYVEAVPELLELAAKRAEEVQP